ncbi:MAG: NAD(P)H-hydrate dehydratase [Planctomycetota bacterium]
MKIPQQFWRAPSAHKFSTGKLLVAAGSRGLAGAGILTARAAVAAGCGYVMWAVPESIYPGLAASFPDGIVHPCTDRGRGSLGLVHVRDLMELTPHAAVVGPGLSTGADTEQFVSALLTTFEEPLVLDADALTLLSRLGSPNRASRSLVLTPHPGEAARLLKMSSEEVVHSRLESAREIARLHRAVVLLKGPPTVVTDGSREWVIEDRVPALATAGSGDVLSGMIGALLARGVEAYEAACFAAWWHLRAAKRMAGSLPQGFGASELVVHVREEARYFGENPRHE